MQQLEGFVVIGKEDCMLVEEVSSWFEAIS